MYAPKSRSPARGGAWEGVVKAWKRALLYSVPTTLVLGGAAAVNVGKGDPAIIAGGMLGVFILTTLIGLLFMGAESLIDRHAPAWLKRVLYTKVLPGAPIIGPAAEGGEPPRR